MSVIEAIQKWSEKLPMWQQHAIATLFSKGSLSAEDDRELYALLKHAQGVPLPEGLSPCVFSADQVPTTPTAGGVRIELHAIKNLVNVNALALNQCIPIAPKGLTAIYGSNGSGKSGYSRVLKKACRARDQSELILPDARLPIGERVKAEASFDLLVNEQQKEVKWIDGEPPPKLLSSIAIFDSHCARAYIDDQDDFSYVPYGLDILENLAKACTRLESMLNEEYRHAQPHITPYAKLAATPGTIGKTLRILNSDTDPQKIEMLAILTDEQEEKRQALEKVLKEDNPKDKAGQLRLQVGRLASFSRRCSDKIQKIGTPVVQNLRSLVDKSKEARIVADLAAKNFRDTPGLLPGTGGDVWQELLAAARKFSTESHQNHQFPNLPADSLCPLCQQPLNDASQRLVAFDTFIQQEAEKAARMHRTNAAAVYIEIRDADLSIQFDTELKTELTAIDAALAGQCDALQAEINTRRAEITAACKDDDWTVVGTALADPVDALVAICDNLLLKAVALEQIIDEEGRAIQQREFEELEARAQLAALQPTVLEALAKMRLQKLLTACKALVYTKPISTKSAQLVDKVVSKGLADALNQEFVRLNVGHLHVRLKSTTIKGKTLHKLVIEFPGAAAPNNILSEGEQRAVALASFLAEINISGGNGCVVFDDPMSSLDHRRRELVARRLVEESNKRQVIIFTHDMYFLSLLQQQSEASNSNFSSMSLRRGTKGFGQVSPTLPFDGANTKTRVGMLRQLHVDCVKLYKISDEEAYAERARVTYHRLREAWERAIEEVLLNGVVWRFGVGIATQSLREVAVENTDIVAVNSGMTQCSRFAHDGAANANVEVPMPDELLADIEALEAWRKATVNRRDQLKLQRPK